MSVEKAIAILRGIEQQHGGRCFMTTADMIQVIRTMRDLDGPKECEHLWYVKDYKTCWCEKCGIKSDHYAEGKQVCPIPSGYWFINSYFEPVYERLHESTGHTSGFRDADIEIYQKRKSVGNCFSTEAEAMEKLSKLTGGKDE